MGGLHAHTFTLDGAVHKFEFSVRLVLASARQLGLTISAARRTQPCEAGLLWLADEALQHEYDEEEAEKMSAACFLPEPPLSEATVVQYQVLIDERRRPKRLESRDQSTHPKWRLTAGLAAEATFRPSSPRVRRRKRRLRFPAAIDGPLGVISEDDEVAPAIVNEGAAEAFAALASSGMSLIEPAAAPLEREPAALAPTLFQLPAMPEPPALFEMEESSSEPWSLGHSPMPQRGAMPQHRLLLTLEPPSPRALLASGPPVPLSLLRPPSRGFDDRVLAVAAAKCRESRQKHERKQQQRRQQQQPPPPQRRQASSSSGSPGFAGRDDAIFAAAATVVGCQAAEATWAAVPCY